MINKQILECVIKSQSSLIFALAIFDTFPVVAPLAIHDSDVEVAQLLKDCEVKSCMNSKLGKEGGRAVIVQVSLFD